MTRRALRSGMISEQSIKDALVDAKGDLFLVACALDCTVREVDQYIRRSNELQSFASAVEQVKIDPAYSRLSAEQFDNQVANLLRSFQLDGINEVHKLATMDFGDSAALAKVKLEAALALKGGASSRSVNGETENALAELNHLYHQNAPRIKEIRQTVLRFQDGSQEIRPVIELKPNP